jgi:ComF family protein
VSLAPAIAALRTAGRIGLDILLPPTCMACDAPVTAGFQLCAACFSHCHFITAPYCRRCGVPFAYQGQLGAAGCCPGCIEHPPSFQTARAALAYDTHSRDLVLQFKHADRTELARLFAPMLARAGAALLKEADCLVPVPLHRSRIRRRGYNQSALLAQALSRISRVPALLDALERTRQTPSLGHLDAAARRATMHRAVHVRSRRAGVLAGKRILLVDDVMTSGATANACAEALLQAGASRVDAVVVARVPDPELERS